MREIAEDIAEPDTPHPPGARQLLPLLVIAPAITAPVWWIDRTPLVGFWAALATASAVAGVLGIPVLYWALDHGRAHARWLGPLGAIAAAVFPLALLASGTTGQLLLGGRRYMVRVLRRGAPIPGVGQIHWSAYAELVITVVLIGAACGVVYALLRPGQKRRTITF